MVTRKMNKLGLDVSLYGMGLMRLPLVEGATSPTQIDEEKAILQIRTAIDNGVNYFDTAWFYHQEESQRVAGKALQDGYRDKVLLATKSPTSLVKETKDFDYFLNESLARLQTDHIDFYLFHGINAKEWKRVKELGGLEFMERARAEGKIRYICFSFHDDFAAFKSIIDDYDWDMAQVQINYMDEDTQCTRAGVEYAAEKGVAIVVMEPLKGGRLADLPADLAQKLQQEGMPPVEWAFRWLMDLPINVVLSGTSNMEQLESTLSVFQKDQGLTPAQQQTVRDVRAALESRIAVACTHCDYCQPCPMDVHIPNIFAQYNTAKMYDKPAEFKKWYAGQVEKGFGQDKCVGCGQCEAACPQHLPIIDLLKNIHEETV